MTAGRLERTNVPKIRLAVGNPELHQAVQTLDILLLDSPPLLLGENERLVWMQSFRVGAATAVCCPNRGPSVVQYQSYLQPFGDLGIDLVYPLKSIVQDCDSLGWLEVALKKDSAGRAG